MTRYLIVGDIHLSDRAPSSCTDTYLDDLFDILDQTVELETKLQCDGTIWAGDIFHHKQPIRTSYRTMLRAIEVVRKYKNLWIVPGNHDMLNDRLDSITESQPLGVLFHAGAKLLSGWADDDHSNIYGVPWQQEWSQEALETAFAAFHADTRFMHKKALVVTHAPLYPPGQELPFEYYPTRNEQPSISQEDFNDGRRGWADIQGEGFCYYGHVHEAHGIYSVDNVTFANQGSISRGSLHEYNLQREIAVTCWDSEKGFVRVPVKHRPAEEVFRLAEAQEVKDNTAALEDFLASIGRTSIEVTSTEAVIAHIRTMQLAPEVEAAAIERLQEASA